MARTEMADVYGGRFVLLQTNRLVCSQDALPWRNYTEGRLMELPLLRLRERGDLVGHPDVLWMNC